MLRDRHQRRTITVFACLGALVVPGSAVAADPVGEQCETVPSGQSWASSPIDGAESATGVTLAVQSYGGGVYQIGIETSTGNGGWTLPASYVGDYEWNSDNGINYMTSRLPLHGEQIRVAIDNAGSFDVGIPITECFRVTVGSGGAYTGPTAAQFIAGLNNSHSDLFYLVGAVLAGAFAPLFVRTFFGQRD